MIMIFKATTRMLYKQGSSQKPPDINPPSGAVLQYQYDKNGNLTIITTPTHPYT
jgi:hypothetical protein